MKHISDEKMLDMLAKVQTQQAFILRKGYSVHIDASVHEDLVDDDHYIAFDVTFFEENTLIKSFDFSALDTEKELDATHAMFVAYVDSL